MASILLVDDDVGITETLQFLLLNEGYEVWSSRNGMDAILQYKEKHPDVVLMDIKMPIMDGFSAFFKIKEIDSDAKVVLISSYAIDNTEYQQAIKLGLVGLISKPFGVNKIVEIVEKINKAKS